MTGSCRSRNGGCVSHESGERSLRSRAVLFGWSSGWWPGCAARWTQTCSERVTDCRCREGKRARRRSPLAGARHRHLILRAVWEDGAGGDGLPPTTAGAVPFPSAPSTASGAPNGAWPVERPASFLAAAVPVTDVGFGPAISVDEMVRTLSRSDDPVWELIRRQAEVGAANEPQLASSLYATVLNHRRLEDALAFHLANQLESAFFQATQYVELFRDALEESAAYREAIREDLLAAARRDPAMQHAVAVLMYCKGYAALQAYRLAHWLWRRQRRVLALFLQSEISKTFGVDIHPAARIGAGVMIDHATGIVIGETAVVGDNVSILHNVTLGGTGKEAGDRHPKVGHGVLLGAGATILGNILVGDGAQVTACSVVLKDVPPYTVVSGVPAKPIGKLTYPKGVFPSFEMDHRAAAHMKLLDAQQQQPVGAVEDDWFIGDAI